MANTKSDEIIEIEAQLQQMTLEQLALLSQIIRTLTAHEDWDGWETLLAAETSLRKAWDSAEEDAAWANL